MSNVLTNPWMQAVFSIGPFLLLATALFVRTAAITMNDAAERSLFGKYLKPASFALLCIACISMVVAAFSVGTIGLVGLVICGILIVSIIQSEIQFAGVKNRTQQAELLWTLALAIKSRRPLDVEISDYASGATGKRREQLNLFASRLGEGAPLTEIVIPQNLLPDSALMQIHSGIISDSLEESLTKSAMRLTQELAEERETEFTSSGLIYPPALLLIASLIVGFVMYYIIPKFKKIFDDFGTSLPESTISLIQFSDFLVNYWYVFGVPVFLALPVWMCVLVGYAEFHGWHTFWRRTFGAWFVRCHTPDLLRALSHSISNKIPIPESLVHFSHHSNILILRRRLSHVITKLEYGEDVWSSFQSSGFLKPRETAILQAAERVNNLPWALDMLATTIEQRQLFRLRSALEIIQPLFLFPLALIVTAICISLFMPLVKLLNDLS